MLYMLLDLSAETKTLSLLLKVLLKVKSYNAVKSAVYLFITAVKEVNPFNHRISVPYC